MSLSRKWFLKQIRNKIKCRVCGERLTKDSIFSQWHWTGKKWQHSCDPKRLVYDDRTFQEVLKIVDKKS